MGSSRIRLFRLASHHEDRLPPTNIRFHLRKRSATGDWIDRYTCTLTEAMEYLCSGNADGDVIHLDISEHVPVHRVGHQERHQFSGADFTLVNRSGVVSLERILRSPASSLDATTDFTDNPEPELVGKMRKWVVEIVDATKPQIAPLEDE